MTWMSFLSRTEIQLLSHILPSDINEAPWRSSTMWVFDAAEEMELDRGRWVVWSSEIVSLLGSCTFVTFVLCCTYIRKLAS